MPLSSTISARTRWTRWSSSWRSRKSSRSRSRTRTPRRSRRCIRRSTTSTSAETRADRGFRARARPAAGRARASAYRQQVTKRRVVVTGLGIVSPVGSTVAAAWDAILSGRSGIGQVRGFDVSQYLTPKEAKRMDEFMHYGVAAGMQAVADSGIDFSRLDPARCGAVCGAGIGGLRTIEEEFQGYLESGSPRRISPFFVPATIINMISGHLSIKYGLKGPNLGVVTACTTSTHAIGIAMRVIQYGDADVLIAGGSEMATTVCGLASFAQA